MITFEYGGANKNEFVWRIKLLVAKLRSFAWKHRVGNVKEICALSVVELASVKHGKKTQ